VDPPCRRISGRRKRPIERRAQVVDLTPVVDRPLRRGSRLQFGLGLLEKIPVILGVAAREPFAFPALAELFDRVGPRHVEQAVARDAAVNLRHDQ
jgi:hypothetical protein